MTSSSAGAPTLGPPIVDAFDAVPVLAPFRETARRGDWDALRCMLHGVGSVDDLVAVVEHLARLDGIESGLERSVADRPDDVLVTLLAARYVRAGWEVRTRDRARHVSAAQFEQFHAMLGRAERLLVDVCARRPDLAPAWSTRLATARGLELGHGEARRRYRRLAAHHPHVFAAQAQLLQQLCPKWGGTWEDAFAFARECAAGSPSGSPAGALVATAHLERWADSDSRSGRAHLASAAVRDELREHAARSVLHPDASLGVQGAEAHGAFALVYSLGGHAAAAAPHFRAMGERVPPEPWDYLEDPAGDLVRFREAAFRSETQGEA